MKAGILVEQSKSIHRSYRTARGLIHVRSHSSPDFIHGLEVDSGFGAIVSSDKVRQILLGIASQPTGNVISACVEPERLVGYILLGRPEPLVWQGKTYHRRWERSDVTYELGAIEVSRNYRELGVAGKMMGMLGSEDIEDWIIIAIELSWHWDMSGASMNEWQYRAMMVDLFSAAGFVEMQTDDPEITYHPANVFMARIGSRVSPRDVSQFDSLLFANDV